MKIAIVGGGVSGLSAAFYLSGQHEITLFEQNDYVGGHTNTVSVTEGSETFPVDTGFIVFNDRTYPHFCQLLDALGISSQPTEMSFGLKCEQTGLEYSGSGLHGFYAQRRNVCSLTHHRLLWDVLRFNRLASRIRGGLPLEMTVADFFRQYTFSTRFRDKFFLPMGAAIWSCPTDQMQQFPIRFILDFYAHHGLLGLRDRPQWHVVQGGSRRYVEAMLEQVDGTIHTSNPVLSVRRSEQGVQVQSQRGGEQHFDHVIFACHSDQALTILDGEATDLEREVLGCFPYQRNHALLHTDTSILPTNRQAWACWNYLLPSQRANHATVTYNMNLLQGISSRETYCVSLNSRDLVDENRIVGEYIYHHPVFNTRRDWAQAQHPRLIDCQGISYCGAYWGNGFHEDGVQSARAVVSRLSEGTPG